jgi:hypothetical protein
MGSYRARLLASIQEMADKPEDYFVLNKLKKFSAKMEHIYRRIVGDIKHGAPHLIPDDTLAQQEANIRVCGEYEEPLQYAEEDQEGEGEEEAGPELFEMKMEAPRRVVDPDDELPKYMDVFKTDQELKSLRRRVTGGPALVYSFFNTVEGAGIFSKVLEAHGFSAFADNTWDGIQPFEAIARSPRYAFIKGGMNPRLKAKVMRVFNSPANRHGQLIRVVFVTQAAAEGISLYHLRQIHIMEPHWDHVMIEQVIGRGFRLRSHHYLADKREREIQVYHYMAKRASESELTPDYFSRVNIKPTQDTVDYLIKNIADRKAKLVSQLKLIRGAAAMDCKINSEYNNLPIRCFDFRGNTTGRAFTGDMDKDVEASLHTQTKQVSSSITYSHFYFPPENQVDESGRPRALYITLPSERVSVKLTFKGHTITQEAGVFYSVPSGWRVKDPVDMRDFKKKGYLFGKLEGEKNLMFLDDVSRKGGTLEERPL